MNIAWFSENGFTGKVAGNHANMRIEFAFMHTLDAYHHNLKSINDPLFLNESPDYDLGIVVIPKDQNLYYLENLKKKCKKLALFQEGPQEYYHRYSVEDQKKYLKNLDLMDFILVHNEYDLPYFEGLTGKNCYVLRSLMLPNMLPKTMTYEERHGCMMGGGFSDWYNGMDSYIVAKEFGTTMYCPKMGRNGKDEQNIDVETIPYQSWLGFQFYLNCIKYGVHMMRGIAAGSFMLNCAYWGIPCIAYNLSDTAKYCHPSTTVKLGNIRKAKIIAERLKNDRDFYDSCSKEARENYEDLFEKSVWLERWQDICNKEGIHEKVHT